jgi:lipopolysaccharide transport protein LptA
MKWDMDDRRVTVSSNACLVAARDAWALGGALAAERDAALWMPGLAPERFGTNRTVITGQEMRYDVGAGVVRFSGAVRARDTEFSLEADDVLVMLRPDRTVKSALAVGNVRFLRGDSAASCRKALYLDGTREVVLLGGATVTRGQESVAGGMITYWLDEERAACEDGRMVMYPRGRDGAGASAGGPGFPLLSGWRKKSDG